MGGRESLVRMSVGERAVHRTDVDLKVAARRMSGSGIRAGGTATGEGVRENTFGTKGIRWYWGCMGEGPCSADGARAWAGLTSV